MKISNVDNLKIVKTDLEQLKTIDFDCGDEDLNEFLLKDSFENIKNNLCTIFLCIYEEDVIGFFSLSADSIKINDELKIQYPQYPAIKIGRLAVSKEFQNQHIGSSMIDWVVGFCRNLGNEIGIRFVSVDAYNNAKTINFYNHNQFVELESVKKKKRRNIPMYRDICERLN